MLINVLLFLQITFNIYLDFFAETPTTMKKIWFKLQDREAFLIFIIALFIYALFAYGRLGKASPNNHFAYLAQSFLAGQTHLMSPPPHGNDWASYEQLSLSLSAKKRLTQQLGRPITELKGIYLPSFAQKKFQQQKKLTTLQGPKAAMGKFFKTLKGELIEVHQGEVLKRTRLYYVSFPPFPALLLLPFVALFGLAASDVWLTLFFAAFNMAIAYSSFRKILEAQALPCSAQPSNKDSSYKNTHNIALWLAVSLCFASAHLWCAVRGEVWFTALIIGVSCQLLFFRWAWHLQHPLLAGFAYAAAFSTRASLVFLAVFAYVQLFSAQVHIDFKERLKKLIIFSIPPLCIGLALLGYNYLRFEAWAEFGHTYLAGGQIRRIYEYGLFHWIFLKKNLIAAFALLPLVSTQPPFFTYSWHGMSLFLSNPHIFFFIIPKTISKTQVPPKHIPQDQPTHHRVQSSKLLEYALISFILCLFSLLLLYQNTGWVQYSWRFSLDLLPALTFLLLLKQAYNYKLFKYMVIWGTLINLGGALIFGRYSFYWSAVDLPKLLPH